jgi:hypothetical protein
MFCSHRDYVEQERYLKRYITRPDCLRKDIRSGEGLGLNTQLAAQQANVKATDRSRVIGAL